MSRLILEYNKIPYEDVRVDHENWPKLKSSTVFGQLPILEVDGKQIPQSCAMARFLARQYKLAGKDAFEEAYVDSIADYHKDTSVAIGPHFGVIAGRVEGDKVSIGRFEK